MKKIKLPVYMIDSNFLELTLSDKNGLPTLMIKMQDTESARETLTSMVSSLRVIQAADTTYEHITYEVDLSKRMLTLVGNISAALDFFYAREKITKAVYDILHDSEEEDTHAILEQSKTVVLPQPMSTSASSSSSLEVERAKVHTAVQDFFSTLSQVSATIQKECAKEVFEHFEEMDITPTHTPPSHSPDIKVGGRH